MRIAIVTSLPLLLAAGCYNPSLPAVPFTCATTGKPCPDDYVCNRSTTPPLCQKSAGPTTFDAGPTTDALPTKDGALYLDGSQPQSSDNCLDKIFEPNNSLGSAFAISQGRKVDFEICYPGDTDTYTINVLAAQTLAVKVLFSHDAGDLELAVLGPDGQLVATSRSDTNNEEVEVTAAQTGKYAFVVFGFNGATNKYDLDIRIR